MPEGGRLTVETLNVDLDEAYAGRKPVVSAGPFVMLAVGDTGHGMSRDVQSRIFEPFFTTKEQGKGTGLGLAMVYGIVKQSGGSIWVYSEEGRGTTFKIYLPRCEGDVARLRPPATLPPPGGSETILLAEDDPSMRALAGEVLETAGYEVLSAARGDDALAIARTRPDIDLLLTDVIMPGMGGRDLARRLKEVIPGARILYASGYTGNAIMDQGILEEGLAFLQKPFDADSLAKKVREVLDGARTESAAAGGPRPVRKQDRGQDHQGSGEQERGGHGLGRGDTTAADNRAGKEKGGNGQPRVREDPDPAGAPAQPGSMRIVPGQEEGAGVDDGSEDERGPGPEVAPHARP